ncbi:MAG: C40 family peptidase [Burkholderiales bacterium]|nr:C40 family peptidase [Burkholderiales bacterium]
MERRADVAIYALGLIGIGYKLGGSTPGSGFDCSGLVRYVFLEVTGFALPRTSKEMSTLGSKIQPAELQPGDLVLFNTRRFAYSHVGIYLGDHRFIHAPSRGSEVEIANLSNAYWQKRFNGGRRMVGAMPPVIAPTIATELLPAPPAARILDVADATP